MRTMLTSHDGDWQRYRSSGDISPSKGRGSGAGRKIAERRFLTRGQRAEKGRRFGAVVLTSTPVGEHGVGPPQPRAASSARLPAVPALRARHPHTHLPLRAEAWLGCWRSVVGRTGKTVSGVLNPDMKRLPMGTFAPQTFSTRPRKLTRCSWDLGPHLPLSSHLSYRSIAAPFDMFFPAHLHIQKGELSLGLSLYSQHTWGGGQGADGTLKHLPHCQVRLHIDQQTADGVSAGDLQGPTQPSTDEDGETDTSWGPGSLTTRAGTAAHQINGWRNKWKNFLKTFKRQKIIKERGKEATHFTISR